jgi:hypothetical protein
MSMRKLRKRNGVLQKMCIRYAAFVAPKGGKDQYRKKIGKTQPEGIVEENTRLAVKICF